MLLHLPRVQMDESSGWFGPIILARFYIRRKKIRIFLIRDELKKKKIPVSSEGRQWYEYVNDHIKEQELEGGYKN